MDSVVSREDSTLAVISVGLGIIIWDYIHMFRQELRMLSRLSEHPMESLCFVALRYACLFLFITSVGYLYAKGTLCHAFLICVELSMLVIYVVHSIVLFSFPTSFKSNRRRRIIALSFSLVFCAVMLLFLIISAIHVISHHFSDTLQCQIIETGHWKLAAMGALILFSVVVLLHFLQLGYRERVMRPYVVDIACIGFITLVMVVTLIITPLKISSSSTDFILRNYVVLIITVVDTRLLFNRAKEESESEYIGGIPLPSASILNDSGDEGLTMESTSLNSSRSRGRLSGTQVDLNPRRTSTPFQRYDLYSYYSPSRLDELKTVDYPVVNREVVVALN